MAISLPQGLKITSKEPVDNRILMTKAEMLAVAGSQMPEKYICVCKDDGKLYVYDKSATVVDPEIGKFKPYEDVIDLPKAILDTMETEEGKAAIEEAVASTLPGAIEDAMADDESAQKIAEVMFSSEHFEVNLDNKIDINIGLIQAIDSN